MDGGRGKEGGREREEGREGELHTLRREKIGGGED